MNIPVKRAKSTALGKQWTRAAVLLSTQKGLSNIENGCINID